LTSSGFKFVKTLIAIAEKIKTDMREGSEVVETPPLWGMPDNLRLNTAIIFAVAKNHPINAGQPAKAFCICKRFLYPI